MRAPLLLLFLLLTACGGGTGSPSPQPLPLQDTTPPVITITGDNPQGITTGNAYTELGATATDNLDGNLTSLIVIDASSVDTSAAGNYAVTYNVSDAAGNSAATATRTVTVEDPPPPAEPQVSVSGDIKKLVFSWASVDDADFYRLLENADGHSGFTQVDNDIPAGTLTVSRDIAVHLFDFVNAQYILEACSIWGCSSSDVLTATDVMLDTIGYFKASNPDSVDQFGWSTALSADGKTLAVGAHGERSSAIGVNGDQSDNSTPVAGAVYLFRFDGGEWKQQAYIKSSNSGNYRFGSSIALSSDGDTLAVGAVEERSRATGINGDQSDDTAPYAGAVYVFRFDGGDWSQEAYIKASNTKPGLHFGLDVTLSEDGNTLAVGALDHSSATGINGDQSDDTHIWAGAVYVFRFDSGDWSQEAYIKASNTGDDDRFGSAIALSADGGTLAVGARYEDSSATGINGDQSDDTFYRAGAVYVFRFAANNWSQQAYIKASNTNGGIPGSEAGDNFGDTVALSGDGNTLAVGAVNESGAATGTNGNQDDDSARSAGAVYLFRFSGTEWRQEAYIKASNPGIRHYFGSAVALSTDGNTVAVGAEGERSIATGINGDQYDDMTASSGAGAAYVFRFDGTSWIQQSYVKASNTDQIKQELFGSSIALSADANTLAVGANSEDSSATGINGDQGDNSKPAAGAVYVY